MSYHTKERRWNTQRTILLLGRQVAIQPWLSVFSLVPVATTTVLESRIR